MSKFRGFGESLVCFGMFFVVLLITVTFSDVFAVGATTIGHKSPQYSLPQCPVSTHSSTDADHSLKSQTNSDKLGLVEEWMSHPENERLFLIVFGLFLVLCTVLYFIPSKHEGFVEPFVFPWPLL
ncbi:MAG: hypothetical protein Q7R98_01330 [Candidatus Jorgensenbacteria bacterium]|nr:hypothetical protein [Candidatus Jorgensenbacteria bacterium]